MRKNIEQNFRVGVGVDMAAVNPEELFAQFAPIGEIPVVHKGDAKRGVDIEGLCLVDTVAGSGCRVAYLPQSTVAHQAAHIACPEDVAHQSVRLVHAKEQVVFGCDPGSVLAAMLQKQQTVVNDLINGIAASYPNDSTHFQLPVKAIKAISTATTRQVREAAVA